MSILKTTAGYVTDGVKSLLISPGTKAGWRLMSHEVKSSHEAVSTALKHRDQQVDLESLLGFHGYVTQEQWSAAYRHIARQFWFVAACTFLSPILFAWFFGLAFYQLIFYAAMLAGYLVIQMRLARLANSIQAGAYISWGRFIRTPGFWFPR